MSEWQILPALPAAELAALVELTFTRWHARCFAQSAAAHPGLTVSVRSVQEGEAWTLAQLLTPLALYRLCLPRTAPGVALPAGWSAQARQNAPCTALGPALPLRIPTVMGQAHLQYLPELGHFLLQPQVLGLRRYADEAAVFAAWGGVVEFRRRVKEERARQSQCDRRALLRRLVPGAAVEV